MSLSRPDLADALSSVRGRLAALNDSLLPRVVVAFVLVVAVGALATLFLETRLTRAALERQATSLLLNDLDVVSAHTLSNQSRLATQTRTVAENLSIDLGGPGVRPRLVEAVTQLERAGNLAVVNVFDPSGELLVRTGQQVVQPPPEAFEAVGAADLEAVIPTHDGEWMQVVATSVGRGPTPHMLVAGYRLGDARALELRNLTGSEEVVLVVEGQVVGATSIDLDDQAAPGDPGLIEEPQTIDLGEGHALLGYEGIGRSVAGWGADAAIGLILPSPLDSLDASLLRNRILIVALLVVVAAFLAWLVSRMVVRPLEQLARTAHRISSGDLSASFEGEGDDEIGILASSLERMRSALLSQLHVISRQADALQHAAERVVSAQDDERRRLSRDLHDGLQQRLVMLRLQVGRLTSIADSDANLAIADVADEIEAIIGQLRETGQAIFPSILQDRGLTGGLRSLAGRCPVPMEIGSDPDPLPRLAAELEASAYFVVAEAVTNSLKHAEASTIRVAVRVDGDRLSLAVEDDGTGFEVGGGGGAGLTHLEDRVRALRGELTITSQPGLGTRIEADLPVRSAALAEEEQHGGDAPVELGLVGEAELAEDGVGMLLDRSLGDVEFPRDGGVPTS